VLHKDCVKKLVENTAACEKAMCPICSQLL